MATAFSGNLNPGLHTPVSVNVPDVDGTPVNVNSPDVDGILVNVSGPDVDKNQTD